MAKRSNPKLIGAFVIGGIVLAIVGALAFGGGQFFETKQKAVLYFSGTSLAGLSVGAPVNFRGVKIGTVTSIVIRYDVDRQLIRIPVEIELQPERLQIVSGTRSVSNLASLVERGLRGQLQVQSLVTGQASIEFDFHPDTPIRLVTDGKDMPELPTIPSTMDTLQANVSVLLAKLSQMPIDEIAKNINAAIRDLQQVLADADALVKRVDSGVGPLLGDVQQATTQASTLLETATTRIQMHPGEPLQTLDDTLNQYSELAQQLRGQVGPLGTSVQSTLKSLDTGLARIDVILAMAERDYAKNPALLSQVTDTLREARSMLGAIRALAEYLQRNPNALLTGKQ